MSGFSIRACSIIDGFSIRHSAIKQGRLVGEMASEYTPEAKDRNRGIPIKNKRIPEPTQNIKQSYSIIRERLFTKSYTNNRFSFLF
jgi:hypothetical protein